MQAKLAESCLSKDDVPGRTSDDRFFDFWQKTLLAPKSVLNVLKFGYKIPLREYPPASHLPHNSSGRDPQNQEFLDEEFSYLESVGAIY